MADEQEAKEPKGKASKGYDPADLQAIVSAAVAAALEHASKQTSASNSDLAAAILKAREPYIDPKVKANEASARKSMKEQAARQKATKKMEQAACPHYKGCNNLSAEGKPQDASIAHLRLDTGELIGVCTNCTRVFSSLNPEDVPYLQKKTTNQRASAGGERYFENPAKAQRARLGLDQEEIFVNESGDAVDESQLVAK